MTHRPIGERATAHLATTPRDTDPATIRRRSFGVVGSRAEVPLIGIDPAVTGTLPQLTQLVIARQRDAEERARTLPRRRHRARRPGVVARTWAWLTVGVR